MNKMGINKEWDLFVAHLRILGVVKIDGNCSLKYNDIELMWETWQAAKAQAIPDGFVVVPIAPILKILDAASSLAPIKTMIEAQERINHE